MYEGVMRCKWNFLDQEDVNASVVGAWGGDTFAAVVDVIVVIEAHDKGILIRKCQRAILIAESRSGGLGGLNAALIQLQVLVSAQNLGSAIVANLHFQRLFTIQA